MKEHEQLEGVANSLADLYYALEGAGELASALDEHPEPNEAADIYERLSCQLRDRIEQVRLIAIRMGLKAEYCGMLWEGLKEGAVPSDDLLKRARVEVNDLEVMFRQLHHDSANELEQLRTPARKARKRKPPHPVVAWYAVNGHKYDSRAAAVQAYCEIHADSYPSVYQKLADSFRNRRTK